MRDQFAQPGVPVQSQQAANPRVFGVVSLLRRAAAASDQVRVSPAAFLNKGQAVGINVDGSQGGRINSKNGVILQVIEDDDPGPTMVNGKLVNAGVYREPTGTPTKAATFDVTTAHTNDTVATFADIDLKGDFYNAIRGSTASGKNLVLALDGITLTGVVTASSSKHAVSPITSANYDQLGVVTNTPSAAINNGVIVDLSGGSSWTVTGTSHLAPHQAHRGQRLRGQGPRGKKVTLSVDGSPTAIKAGATYTGALVLTVS